MVVFFFAGSHKFTGKLLRVLNVINCNTACVRARARSKAEKLRTFHFSWNIYCPKRTSVRFAFARANRLDRHSFKIFTSINFSSPASRILRPTRCAYVVSRLVDEKPLSSSDFEIVRTSRTEYQTKMCWPYFSKTFFIIYVHNV